jgi:hypothetical protein
MENGVHPTQFVQKNAQKDSYSANMRQRTPMDAKSNQVAYTKERTMTTYIAQETAHQSVLERKLWCHLDLKAMVVNYHLCAKFQLKALSQHLR